jgi:hypothetical protein
MHTVELTGYCESLGLTGRCDMCPSTKLQRGREHIAADGICLSGRMRSSDADYTNGIRIGFSDKRADTG